jgi:hypothetical protein
VPFDLQPTTINTVRDLCARFHGYASAGGLATYAWAVMEHGEPVAVYAWQPPAPGCARSVCPEAPAGVLMLSRMAAVPRDVRLLKHVSKPLRHQMKHLIDRTRWPVLVTFSDEGQGHTGYVYQCSGWTPTVRRRVAVRTNIAGDRVSRYANGRTNSRDLIKDGSTWVQRWEHWACDAGTADQHMSWFGWMRVPRNRNWASGNPGYRWVCVRTIVSP